MFIHILKQGTMFIGGGVLNFFSQIHPVWSMLLSVMCKRRNWVKPITRIAVLWKQCFCTKYVMIMITFVYQKIGENIDVWIAQRTNDITDAEIYQCYAFSVTATKKKKSLDMHLLHCFFRLGIFKICGHQVSEFPRLGYSESWCPHALKLPNWKTLIYCNSEITTYSHILFVQHAHLSKGQRG